MAESERLPIVDMHLHAYAADALGPGPLPLCLPLVSHMPRAGTPASEPPCPDPIWSPATDEALIRDTVAALEARNIFGVLSGSPKRVPRWLAVAPERFIPALEFRLGDDAPSPDELRPLLEDGHFAVFGEILNQYAGIAPDDARMPASASGSCSAPTR